MSASIAPADGAVDYRARRRGTTSASRFRYRPLERGREAAPGTREFFLAERYTLFAHDARRDRLWAGRVAHAPYRLAAADVPQWDDTMLRLAGFDPRGRTPDHVCAAAPVEVDVFPLEPVAR